MADALALVRLDSARQALMESRDLSEVKAIRDQAEAMRQYARASEMGLEAQNHAAQIKLMAERRLGELLAIVVNHNGGRPNGKKPFEPQTVSSPRLADIGISRFQSHRFQVVAGIPELVYEQHVAEVLAQPNGELTTAAVVKLANDLKRSQPAKDAPTGDPPDGRFTTLVADPPWKYSNVATRAAAEDHYPTLSVPELCALNIGERAVRDCVADAAHLYLWTTNAFLREAFEIVDAWGFQYKTALVWVKPQLGIGNYFRSSHEYVLFGVRGGLHVLDSNQRSWFEVERGRHSQKPDFFYDLVEKVSPGPYLELFARTDMFGPRKGWTPWGNQAGDTQL